MNTTPFSTLHFTSTTASDGIAERTFTLGDISGVLWSPESATDGAPLLLMGHGGGLHRYAPGLVSRARRAVAGDGSGDGLTVAATTRRAGDRPRSDQDQLQVDATRRARAAGERALVLGGGGSAGNAWLIGVIAGLFDAGLDVTEADLIIGTSAGSTAAAQITSATRPAELLADILAAAPQPRTGPVGSDGGRVPNGPVADHMERTSEIIAAAEDAADMRRRLGAAALEMDAASDGSGQTRWRATVAARLPSQHWPERTVLIMAVDAHTGEPVVFDRHSGVDLVDAVAASCARARRPSLQYRRQPIHRRRLPIQRECRSGSRIRAGAGAVTTRRQITGAAGLGHASRSTGRRTTRTRQQSRNHLPGQQLPQRIRRQSDGSVDASARRSSRLRPRQSPCRAAHRILALTPTKPVDSVGVTTPAHALDGRWARRACGPGDAAPHLSTAQVLRTA